MDRGRFTIDALLTDASARCGLTDFGDTGDARDGFRDALAVLVGSALDEARLRDPEAFRDLVVHHLVNRLRIAECLRRVPAIAATPMPAPLFVSGLPRAGTTTFSRLLGADRAIRSPKLWELHSPAPTDLAHPWALTEDRLAAAEQLVIARAQRGTLAIRPISLFAADECFYLMRNSFDSDHLHRAYARMPSYFGWVGRRDRAAVYAYYRAQLQLLLWQRPVPVGGTLVVKNPFIHLENLPTVFALFPGALVLNLSRDVASVVASLCYKNRSDRLAHSEHVRAHDVGADMVDNLDHYYARRAAALAALDPVHRARIITIPFDAWADRSIAIMRELYPLIGRSWSPDIERAMTDALPRHAGYGERAKYDLGEFGLSADALRARFTAHERAFADATRTVGDPP